jgi:nicotinate phosphoribosyltransferase
VDAAGTAQEEIILLGDGPGGSFDSRSGLERALLVPLISDGTVDERYVGPAGTLRARAHNASVMQELPIEAFRLGRGEPVIPTSYR